MAHEKEDVEEEEDNADDDVIEVGRVRAATKGEIVVSVGCYTPEGSETLPATIRIGRVVPSTGKKAVDGVRRRPLGSLKSADEALGLAELLKKAVPVLKKALKA